jgi:hypothetical protein
MNSNIYIYIYHMYIYIIYILVYLILVRFDQPTCQHANRSHPVLQVLQVHRGAHHVLLFTP